MSFLILLRKLNLIPVRSVDDVDNELDGEDDTGHHPKHSNIGPSVAATESIISSCLHHRGLLTVVSLR